MPGPQGKAPGIALALLLALVGGTAHAYEVDNFTGRDRPVSDSLQVLDGRVNAILRKAAKKANQESPFRCNRVLLRSQVLRWVRPDPISFLELWATFSDEIDRIEVARSQSVYSGARLGESPAIWLAGIGQSFKLDGKIVGTDKLGHFFMQGFGYFKEVEDGKTIDQVVRAEHGEDGIFGLTTTGVMSYADMAANYSGYTFWKELYAGEKPYFRCEEGKGWVQTRSFTWKDYVSDAWDEAINCSVMKPSLGERVEANLRKQGMSCPVSAARCSQLEQLEFADVLVSPRCQSAAKEYYAGSIRTTSSSPDRGTASGR